MIIAAGLFACGNVDVKEKSDLEKFSDNYWEAFDTVITFTAYCKTQEEFDSINSQVHKDFIHYHQLFDIYNDYGELNNAKTINDQAGIAPVEVEQDLIKLIDYAKSLYEKTEGNINIAFGSVLKLWHNAREVADEDPEKAYIPAMDELQAASLHCDIDNVIIDYDNSTVFLTDPEMSIDLGCIAKGYATELIAQKLIAEGHTNMIISAGGNVRTIGVKPDGSSWVVAIQDPSKSETNPYAITLKVDGTAVVTSGTYERYFELDGVRYHHIINKDSLMPENNYLSVSILTENSGYADALSTAVFNMDLETGMKFINSLDNVYAMWILNDNSQVYSNGFETFIKK